MNERLTFNARVREIRTRRAGAGEPGDVRPKSRTGSERLHAQPQRAPRAGGPWRDWAWLGLLAFTVVVFLRPKISFRPLEQLHLAEVSALVGLVGMITARLTRPDPGAVHPGDRRPDGVRRCDAGRHAVLVLAGGSFKDFVEIYLKVLVIVVLMIHALDRAERIDRLIVLIVVSSGFVAVLSVFDYMRGIHVVRGDRLTAPSGGYTATQTTLRSTWWCSCRLRSRPYSSRVRRPGVSWRHCAPAS